MHRFASGRAEDIVSFSRTSGSKSRMFVKKVRKVPCCRRRSRPCICSNAWF